MTLFRKIFCFLLLVSLVPVIVTEFPPLQDYPNHLARASILAQYQNPDFDFAENFDVLVRPIPNCSWDILVYALSKVLSIQMAGRAVLMLYLILFPLSVYFFLAKAVPQNRIFSLFAFLFTYNSNFHLGNLNFVLSLPIFFFTLGLWVDKKRSFGFRKQGILAALAMILYLSHLFTFAYFVLVVFLLVLGEPENLKSRIRKLSFLLPSLGLLVWFFIGTGGTMATLGSPYLGETEQNDLSSTLIFVSLWNKCRHFYFLMASFSKLWDLLILFIPLCLYGWYCVKGMRSNLRNPWALLFLVTLGLYFVSPSELSPLVGLHTRFLIFLAVLGLAVFKAPLEELSQKRIALTLGFFFCAWVSYLTFSYRSWDGRLRSYAECLKSIPAGQRISTQLVQEPLEERPLINPTLHFSAYYHVFKGGFSTRLFAGPYYLLRYKNVSSDSQTQANDFIVLSTSVDELSRSRIASTAELFCSCELAEIYEVQSAGRISDKI